jgi:hypothetical protein
MENPDRTIREKAAADWLAWEDAVISNEPNGVPGMYSDREVDAQIAFVRICAHFFSNGARLDEDQLLCNAHKLAGIPAVLLHGRHDMGSPVQTAWEPAKAWLRIPRRAVGAPGRRHPVRDDDSDRNAVGPRLPLLRLPVRPRPNRSYCTEQVSHLRYQKLTYQGLRSSVSSTLRPSDRSEKAPATLTPRRFPPYSEARELHRYGCCRGTRRRPSSSHRAPLL